MAGGDCGPGGRLCQPTTPFMTISHLQADCQEIGISSWPNADFVYGNNFTFRSALLPQR